MHWLLRAKHARAALAIALGLLLAIGAAGCSLSGASSSARSRPPIVLPTEPPRVIVITTDRRRYTPSEVIGVTVQNVTGTPYYAIEQYSACTFLALQFRDRGAWKAVQPCIGGPQPQVRQLPPKVAFPLSFGPGNAPDNPNIWQVGTYRFALAYGTKADGSGATSITYSASFAVGS